MQDENILIRALEPEDLEYLYKWENDMDLWDVSDTLTPYPRAHRTDRPVRFRPLSPAGRPGNHDSQYGKPQTRLCQLGD